MSRATVIEGKTLHEAFGISKRELPGDAAEQHGITEVFKPLPETKGQLVVQVSYFEGIMYEIVPEFAHSTSFDASAVNAAMESKQGWIQELLDGEVKIIENPEEEDDGNRVNEDCFVNSVVGNESKVLSVEVRCAQTYVHDCHRIREVFCRCVRFVAVMSDWWLPIAFKWAQSVKQFINIYGLENTPNDIGRALQGVETVLYRSVRMIEEPVPVAVSAPSGAYLLFYEATVRRFFRYEDARFCGETGCAHSKTYLAMAKIRSTLRAARKLGVKIRSCIEGYRTLTMESFCRDCSIHSPRTVPCDVFTSFVLGEAEVNIPIDEVLCCPSECTTSPFPCLSRFESSREENVETNLFENVAMNIAHAHWDVDGEKDHVLVVGPFNNLSTRGFEMMEKLVRLCGIEGSVVCSFNTGPMDEYEPLDCITVRTAS